MSKHRKFIKTFDTTAGRPHGLVTGVGNDDTCVEHFTTGRGFRRLTATSDLKEAERRWGLFGGVEAFKVGHVTVYRAAR